MTKRGIADGSEGVTADIRSRAAEIHRELLVLDGHVDVFVSTTHPLLRLPNGASHTDLDRLQRGQINAVVLSVAAQVYPRNAAGHALASAEAKEKLETIHGLIRDSKGVMQLALTAGDVRRIAEDGGIAVLIGFQNAQHLNASLSDLDRLYAEGVRVLDMTHAGNNDFADSSRSGFAEHGGLSPLGRRAIAKMNALGMLIDVSQLSEAGLLQTVELSKAPIVATHSAVGALAQGPRNLSDDGLDAIKSIGGVVLIPAFGRYLKSAPNEYDKRVAELRTRFGLGEEGPAEVVYRGYQSLSEAGQADFFGQLIALWPEGDLETFVNHIGYAVKRIGIDHVGIGNDFNHGGGIVGFADLGEAGAVTEQLVRRGYRKTDIAKVWGGNFLRVLQQAQDLSKRA